MLAEAHRRKIRIILDLVPNHTSDQHPWFVESRSSRHNPKRDWYIWVAGEPDRPPNNWLSSFGGPAWEYDPATGLMVHAFVFEGAARPQLSQSRGGRGDARRDSHSGSTAAWTVFGST